MKAPLRFLLLSVLSLSGLVVSIIQSVHFFAQRNGLAGFRSFCTFGRFDCQSIDASPYAQLLPGYPLSAFAAGWFLTLFITSILARPIEWRREGLKASMALTSVALAFSVFYLFIMISVIKTYCLLCLIIDGINLASFITVMTLMPNNVKKGSPNQSHWKVFAGIGVAGLAFAFLLSIALGGQNASQREVDEIVADTVNSAIVQVNISEKDAQIGPKDAPITIVKFSDFECPACRRGALSLHPVMKAFEGKIRFVFKNFPLDSSCNRSIQSAMHVHACASARVGWCALQKGDFVHVYETLFERQSELADGGPIKLVARNEAEAKELQACADSEAAKKAIIADIDEGIRVDIRSTPTFFINGRRVQGSFPPYIWNKIIQELLKKS